MTPSAFYYWVIHLYMQRQRNGFAYLTVLSQFKPDIYSEVAFQNISINWPIDPYSCKYPQHIHLAGMQFS